MERLVKLQLFTAIERDSILQLDSILVDFADTFALTDLGKLDIAGRQLKLNMVKSSAGKLAADVASVSPLDTIAHLWKELLSMAYGKWADDDSTTVLTGADSTRLWDIGALCPYTFGPAVYLARTILFSLDSAYFLLGNDCEVPYYFDPSGKREDPEDESDVESEHELTVRLYPNPTKGLITVQFSKEFEGKYTLHVVGLDGRVLSIISLTDTTNNIDLQSLSSGLYFIEIEDGLKSPVFNGKVILLD